ncbi:MAG: hypothetical protein WKG01_14695 [Kofleriaceae bacterium]
MRSLTLLALVACSQEEIGITRDESADYNLGELTEAVDKFVAAGKTPAAFGVLAKRTMELREGMDRSVAEEAELKLIVLALAPIAQVKDMPLAAQVDALALTVWPTLLSPEVEADAILFKRDPDSAILMPGTGESAVEYLRRLCGTPLAGDCKQVVPEYQGAVISALATRRATERARNAVSACMMCAAEAGWHEAVRQWEDLDRQVTSWISEVERKADPANWPTAGAAGIADPGLPEAQISDTGQVVVDGQRHSAPGRIDALREVRGEGTTLALHLRPDLSLAQVKGVLSDARKAGAKKIAVIARAPHYPWDRKVYWLAENAGQRAVSLRPTDSLQLLLHTVDHVATPGAVARVN